MSKAATEETKEESGQYEMRTIGWNKYGQQLNGTTRDVKRLETVKHIKRKAINAIHTMYCGATVIVHEDGDISVGGYNAYGQLGVGTYDAKITTIHHLDFKVELVSKGIYSRHVFIIKAKDGKLYSVGNNDYNQCGIQSGSDKINTWMAVPLMKIVIQSIATGFSFTIFLGTNGSMHACGKSDHGALGMGSKKKVSATPTIIHTQVKIKAIVAGERHCVAISVQQRAYSWGSNGRGQCGHGQNNQNIFEPTRIEALRNQSIKQVECGTYHTLLVGSDGVLFTTGHNGNGQCGDGTTRNIFEPKRIRVGENESVQSVKCGARHNALTTTNNKIFVWGRNVENQCLIDFDKDKVLSPTLYPIPDMYKHRNVQVFPGFYGTRVTASPVPVIAAAKRKQPHRKEHNETKPKKGKKKRASFSLKEPKESKPMKEPSKKSTHHKEAQPKAENPPNEEQSPQASTIKEMKQEPKQPHPEQWNEDEVATWLGTVDGGKYARYKKAFIDNEVDGEELFLFNESVLARPQFGIKKLSHQRGIAQAIKNLSNAWNKSNDDDTKEEMKSQSDVKTVENGLVMFFGSSVYESSTYPDLDDIIEDEECLSDVFEDKFNYRFISNGEYKNKQWTKTDAEDWIELIRDKELIHNGEVRYDALIFCGASHGSMHAMICSDGKELKLKDIRSSFASNVNRKFRALPKIFIFNCCRTPYQKPRSTEEETRAAGNSVTITGTEGDKVFGSRLSQYVANAFASCCANKLNVHKTLRVAAQNAKKGNMELRLQEHDIEIDDVVFVKRPKGRGAVSNPLLDADDDLTNVLCPQKNGSKLDLCYKGYYNALFNGGFKNNASLRTLSVDKLNGLGIKMVFHQKELLKRIARL